MIKRNFGKKTCLFFLLGQLIFSCTAVGENPARSGILDLSKHNFAETPFVALNGEWEFYWNKLYSPLDFAANDIHPRYFFSFPGVWNNYAVNGKKLSSSGYATFRLHVVLPKALNRPLALKMPVLSTSAKLWVNGELLAEAGVVGRSSALSVPRNFPQVVDLNLDYSKTRQLDIILQIANFYSDKGGPWNSVLLGTKQNIQYKKDRSLFLETVLIGILLISAIYNGLLFFWKKEHRRMSLSFAAFSFCLLLYYLNTQETSFLLSGVSWQLTTKIEIISVMLSLQAISYYTYDLFSRQRIFLFHFLIGAVGSICALLSLVLPVKSAGVVLFANNITILFACLYFLYLVCKSLLDKKRGAFIIAGSSVFLIAGAVNDILNSMIIIQTGLLSPIGMVVFIISHLYVITEETKVKPPARLPDSVTRREKQIIILLFDGLSYTKIAEELEISIHTVKRHIENIYRKCSVESKFELLTKYRKENM